MDAQNEGRIIRTWRDNADSWSEAVRSKAIASRRLVTDEAILAAVASRHPRTLLDIGCGEGWLARELALRGIAVTGIDATAALIELARAAGGATYICMTYDELSYKGFEHRFDMAVCNFSLLGNASTEAVIRAAPLLLEANGTLAVQTLHPATLNTKTAYVRDGWRESTWAGCGKGLVDPAPWYFRTLASWISLFRDAGLELLEVGEPRHPETGTPVSLLFILTASC